jgi:hypothetical protein
VKWRPSNTVRDNWERQSGISGKMRFEFHKVSRQPRKSPSDGQGRVAHRRGSRFYTTILRVVTELNTACFGKLRTSKNCLRNSIGAFPDPRPKGDPGFRVPKADYSGREPAWLRVALTAECDKKVGGDSSGSCVFTVQERLFILAPRWGIGGLRPGFSSAQSCFPIEFEPESPYDVGTS